MTSDSHSVLLVTKDTKLSALMSAVLIQPMFSLSVCNNFYEARRLCAEQVYNIVIVDFCDGEGADFATDISDSLSTILLICPTQHFDQVSYKVESYGILTMQSEFDQFYLYNIIKIAIAVHYKVQALSSKTTKLKEKMEEIRIVNRAKMLLMQNLSMTEQEAHRYLEKEAMDKGEKKIDLAQNIIKTYG